MAAKKKPTPRGRTATKKATPTPAKATTPNRDQAPRRTLRLNRRIYSRRAVNDTVAAFDKLADAQVTLDGEYHRIELILRDEDLAVDTVMHEFANYALGRAAGDR